MKINLSSHDSPIHNIDASAFRTGCRGCLGVSIDDRQGQQYHPINEPESDEKQPSKNKIASKVMPGRKRRLRRTQ